MYNTSKKITNKEAKNIVANKSIIWVDDSDIGAYTNDTNYYNSGVYGWNYSIAYNLAFTYATDYRNTYKKNASRVSESAISDFIHEAVNWCMKMWKDGEPYQTTPNKYNIDLIFCCLNAGMENYFKGDYAILSSYEEIGRTFPSRYL